MEEDEYGIYEKYKHKMENISSNYNIIIFIIILRHALFKYFRTNFLCVF